MITQSPKDLPLMFSPSLNHSQTITCCNNNQKKSKDFSTNDTTSSLSLTAVSRWIEKLGIPSLRSLLPNTLLNAWKFWGLRVRKLMGIQLWTTYTCSMGLEESEATWFSLQKNAATVLVWIQTQQRLHTCATMRRFMVWLRIKTLTCSKVISWIWATAMNLMIFCSVNSSSMLSFSPRPGVVLVTTCCLSTSLNTFILSSTRSSKLLANTPKT